MRISAGLFLLMLFMACGEEPAKNIVQQELEPWFSAVDSNSIAGYWLGEDIKMPEGWSDTLITLDQDAGPKVQDAIMRLRVEKGSIEEIRLIYRFDSLSHVSSGFQDLAKHFTDIYGPNRPTKGYGTWKTASTEGQLVEVELIDAQVLFQRPEIEAQWKIVNGRLYED